MTTQEVTFSILVALALSIMPSNNGNSQDAIRVETSSEPVVPEAIKRKVEKIKEKSAVEDSLINRLDAPAEIIKEAVKEVAQSSKVLDNTNQRLDRIIVSLAPVKVKRNKMVITAHVEYKKPVGYTVPESKPVEWPQVCPAEVERRNLFQRIFHWIR
ncbi:hypothetical protein MUK70_11780 [Dyadobacter chenwenxiniae]|uniref:Uncharacterized protein n=1 Tax=Dyadobacter chenwenxiniae TaxID=2906456 RepID=A0A9X1TBL0_9BACT|nr:hypothetical protein [Dyadobacter chenwenxiniae]MCF0059921.1 hypothetical protein [Dyadobacter chenwenxiniae]UON85660.1 hypothetical protein MUK70_11780 [Dyadobacter chenwenxiniae]